MWREIIISLTREMDKLEVRVEGNRKMRNHDLILAIGAKGHVVSDWNFIDLHIGGVKGM